MGSPPRVREKRNFNRLMEYLNGITPACAGKTKTERAHRTLRPGSPPRVREKLRVAQK